jgi:undecaprenyl-diphosphatase
MIDELLLIFFNQILAHPVLDLIMVGLSYVGLALLPSIGVMLLFSQQRKIGLTILAALAASLTITLIFQYLALRPRPEGVRLLFPTPNFPSYPSGHAATAFAVALVLTLTYRRWHWQALALGGAGLIALSRVYLGYHYPSDIVGGAILGAGTGAASYGLITAQPSNQLRWRWLLWPQVGAVAVITQMAYLNLMPWRLLTWPLADKVLHFVLFGLVVFLLSLWLGGQAVQLGRWFIPLALLAPLTIALLEEVAQAWSPQRTASLEDWLCDLAGMLFFWWLSRRIFKLKSSQQTTVSEITP